MSALDYPRVLRDVLGLFKIGEEQRASAKMIAETLGLEEYAVTHVKRFMDVSGGLNTRIVKPLPGNLGRSSMWTVTMTYDEMMARLRALGLDDFSTRSRAKIASGVAFAQAKATSDAGRKEAFEESREQGLPIPDDPLGPYSANPLPLESDPKLDVKVEEKEEAETVNPSKKHLLLEIFQKYSDKRGKVKGLTWKTVQTLVGDGVGLHAVFHLCRSLQRDGAIRFIDLPTHLQTAEQAARTYVDISVVIRKKRRTGDKSGPAFVTKGPEQRPQNGRAMPNGSTPVYVPYLSPAGPVPPTPEAKRLRTKIAALRSARDSLDEAGMPAMVREVEEKIEDLLSTPLVTELLALADWAEKTANQAVVNEAKERAASKQVSQVS